MLLLSTIHSEIFSLLVSHSPWWLVHIFTIRFKLEVLYMNSVSKLPCLLYHKTGLKWDSIIIYCHVLLSILLQIGLCPYLSSPLPLLSEKQMYSPLQDHPMLLNCFPPSKPLLSAFQACIFILSPQSIRAQYLKNVYFSVIGGKHNELLKKLSSNKTGIVIIYLAC